MSDVDVVVIGSGPGGLAAAVGLARGGKRVLVVEQHELPGGWSHSFQLGGYRFSPGVHYIGELGAGGGLRRIYEGLGVSQDLTFYELNPDGYEHAHLNGHRFDWPATRPALQARLIDRFPHQAEGIRSFLDITQAMYREVGAFGDEVGRLHGLARVSEMPTVLRYGWMKADALLRHLIDDPVLRGILSVQAGDHATPLDRVPALVQTSITAHYLDGGFYPKGGARAIPKAFIKALRRHGGEIRISSGADAILVEHGRAIGVRLEDGTEIRADVVVSNADPGETWGRLVPRDQVPAAMALRLGLTGWSPSSLMLFFAVDDDVRARGIDSGNLWFGRTVDVGSIYALTRDQELDPTRALPGMYMGCSSLKDPGSRRDGHHTFEAISFVSEAPFDAWRGTTPDTRPPAYQALKAQLTERMLEMVDDAVPGLRERIVFHELGTPLTNEYFVRATHGAVYGTARSLWNMAHMGFPVQTAIEGLYEVGASTICHGVYGAHLSGVHAAQLILGCSREELLDPAGPELEILPAEPAPESDARASG